VRVLTVRLRRALHGIGGIDRDDMFIHMVLVHVVEMAIMEIIDVPVMEDLRMPTVGTVLVSMVGMMFLGAGGHGVVPSWTAGCEETAVAACTHVGSCARPMSKQKCRPAHRTEQTIA
jgi:hypothetical protein